MSDVIINEYNKFCVNLSDSTIRDNLFNNTICVGRIAKSLKAFTTRYLQIVINYSGIDKDNLPKVGLITGSTAQVYDGGELKVYYFTQGQIINNIEQEGTWDQI